MHVSGAQGWVGTQLSGAQVFGAHGLTGAQGPWGTQVPGPQLLGEQPLDGMQVWAGVQVDGVQVAGVHDGATWQATSFRARVPMMVGGA